MIILTTALIPLLFVIFMSNDNSNNNENVRDIYLQNESYIDYYFDKYDLLSGEEKVIYVEETISLSGDTLNNLSYDEDYLSFALKVEKNKMDMEFEYDLLYADQYSSNFLSIGLLFDEEIYIVTRYGYITLDELMGYLNISECSSEPLSGKNNILGNKIFLYGAGAAIGGALAAVAISSAKSNGFNFSTSSSSSVSEINITTPKVTNNSTNSIDSSKAQRLFDRGLKLKAKDLQHEAGDTTWSSDGEELANAFKNACKAVTATGLVALVDYLIDKPIICLGVFIDYSEHKKYTTESLNYENSIIFSMDEDKWYDYEMIMKKNMWVLNQLFLDYWIDKDCIFLLLTNPNCFYIQ